MAESNKSTYQFNRRRHVRLIAKSSKHINTIISLIEKERNHLCHWKKLIEKFNTPFQNR